MFTEEMVKEVLDETCELVAVDFDHYGKGFLHHFTVQFQKEEINFRLSEIHENQFFLEFSLEKYTDEHTEKASEICRKLQELSKTNPTLRLLMLTRYELFLGNVVIEDEKKYQDMKEHDFMNRHIPVFKRAAENTKKMNHIDFKHELYSIQGYGRRGKMFGELLTRSEIGYYQIRDSVYQYKFKNLKNVEANYFINYMNKEFGFGIDAAYYASDDE